MGTAQDVNKVKRNLVSEYEKKRIKIFALSLFYAGKAINDFRQIQENAELYWDNQTNQAVDSMFTNAFMSDDVIGWFMSHGKEYGIYLELANDRQNEAIRPIILKWAPRFYKDAREII